MNQYLKMKNKKAQEEMIGFGLIIIIVAVILLVFLAVSLNKSKEEDLGPNEVNSFIQATLSYTTSCAENPGDYYSIQKLITECVNYESLCLDERRTCDVLNSTLKEILDESWKINENTHIKGYEFFITVKDESLISLEKGNQTLNNKGASQPFPHSVDVSLTVHY